MAGGMLGNGSKMALTLNSVEAAVRVALIDQRQEPRHRHLAALFIATFRHVGKEARPEARPVPEGGKNGHNQIACTNNSAARKYGPHVGHTRRVVGGIGIRLGNTREGPT